MEATIMKCIKTQAGCYAQYKISNLYELDNCDKMVCGLIETCGTFKTKNVRYYDYKMLNDVYLIVTKHSYIYKKNGEMKTFFARILNKLDQEKVKTFCFENKIKGL